MSWLDNLSVPAGILKSKGEVEYKSKVRSNGRKKKKAKKGPKPTSFNMKCCGKQDTYPYRGKTYCNVCARSVG